MSCWLSYYHQKWSQIGQIIFESQLVLAHLWSSLLSASVCIRSIVLCFLFMNKQSWFGRSGSKLNAYTNILTDQWHCSINCSINDKESGMLTCSLASSVQGFVSIASLSCMNIVSFHFLQIFTSRINTSRWWLWCEEERNKIVTSTLPSPKTHPRMGMEKRVITATNPKKHAEKFTGWSQGDHSDQSKKARCKTIKMLQIYIKRWWWPRGRRGGWKSHSRESEQEAQADIPLRHLPVDIALFHRTWCH